MTEFFMGTVYALQRDKDGLWLSDAPPKWQPYESQARLLRNYSRARHLQRLNPGTTIFMYDCGQVTREEPEA